jgi:predicted lipoprotein with Yx(FWY)xxD motif
MRPTPRWTLAAGLVAGAALLVSACASAGSTPGSSVEGAMATMTPGEAASLTLGSRTSPDLGTYLTGQSGMTLYIFTVDAPDVSNCSGGCATNWPPLTVAPGTTISGPSGATGTFGTITRADGSIQVTYDHMPLYYFAGDSVAGDTNGQGVGGNWFVALVGGPGASPSATVAPTDTPDSGGGYS